jgi:chromosome segregation ATPase
MDLAQSILKELITLQKKNEELARIITKLEHESDIIIQQFETKIEELKKCLKHEQDDKLRASRRYDEEIRDLQSSKDALIHEISDVRETFLSRISHLEEKNGVLTERLAIREKEFSDLIQEKEEIISHFAQDLKTLDVALSEREKSAESEREVLTSQVQALTDSLKQDHTQFIAIIEQKDLEIQAVQGDLTSARQHLHEFQDREKALEQKLHETNDHFNHLIHTERQIRDRELKERDERIRISEEAHTLAEETIHRQEYQYRAERESADHEIARLNSTISEFILQEKRYQENIENLESDLQSRIGLYEEQLKNQEEKFYQETSLLKQSLNFLTAEFEHSTAKYDSEVHNLTQDRELLSKQVQDLTLSHRHTEAEQKEIITTLKQSISDLTAEKAQLIRQISDILAEPARLKNILKQTEKSFEKERIALHDEISLLRVHNDEAENTHNRELSRIQNLLTSTMLERDQISSAKQERDEYYRDEITRLHSEISVLHSNARSREEHLKKELVEKDSRIAVLSMNNEAIRTEAERVRSQLGNLQEIIRAEKDESVHALYREITSLEERLADKNAEASSLSERLLRLDAENTRLIQALSQATTHGICVQSDESGLEPDKSAIVPDARKRELSAYVVDLEDPTRAAGAAENLIAMGCDIVEHLIPLLHTGSIQRRVWIAVVLYEFNDNRATLPLMKLLETPKVHFRELIWEAKNQYHTRIRMGTGPSESAALRPGSGGPGGFAALK